MITRVATPPPPGATDEAPRAPVVTDGKINYTSVSALQKAHTCPRAWWYKYVARLPDEKKSAGLQRGTEGHARLAHYLTTGQDVLDPLERLGVSRGYVPEYLPLGALVEHSIEGTAAAGPIPMKGSIDLYVPGSAPGREGVAIVRDWKFKAAIGKWGCSAEDLIDPDTEAGIQMIGYAAFAVQQGATEVEVSHVSFQTRGRPDVAHVGAKISAETVAGKWAEVVNRIVPEIIHAAYAPPKDVRANHDACRKYGGCPFRDTCLSRMARLAGGFAQYLKK